MILSGHLEKQAFQMSRPLKKVIIVLVEGETEEILLKERLREIFSKHQIHFDVQRGDLFFDFNRRQSAIKNVIGDVITSIMKVRKYKKEDIVAVLQIIDTDGVFIRDENIVINNNQEMATVYNENEITVKNKDQREFIIERNQERKRNINMMNSVESVIKGKIPYQIYYMSRHLEHVVFNEPNPNKDKKVENMDRFIDNLTEHIEDFLSEWMFHLDGKTLVEKYRESWMKISRETESLKRRTNVPLLFDYLDEILKNKD